MLAFGVAPMWTWLLFPLLLVALIVLTTAVSMIVSSLYPRFRDTRDHLDACCRPRCSTRARCSTRSRRCRRRCATCIMLNPLAPLLELARKWVIDPSAPGPVALAGGYARLLIAGRRSSSRSASLAVWVFRREAPRIAEEL